LECLSFVLDHLAELVVKEAQGSGGYGMLIGPTASEREREAYRQRILDAPEKFIAQPTLSLSTRLSSRAVWPRAISIYAGSCCPARMS